MIKQGDIFCHTDLFQSVSEIMITDWKKFLHTSLPISLDGKDFHDLSVIGPTGYASLMLYSYDTKSSAHNLDKQIKDKGYKTTYSFAHKYRIPESMRSRILADAARLKWVYEVYSHPNLSKKEFDVLKPIFDQSLAISYYYAQFIWTNDSESAFDYKTKLKPNKDWDKVLDFLLGTAFEFHPKDVYKHITDFSIDGAEYEKQLEFKNWCKKQFDIDTGCLVLSDDNMDKLRAILTKTDEPYSIQLIKKFFNIRSK